MDSRAGEVLINETATACHAEKQIKKSKTTTVKGRMGVAGKRWHSVLRNQCLMKD